MMSAPTEVPTWSGPTASSGPIERIGVPRVLLLGYVGLIVFMIGDGVESNYLVIFYTQKVGFSEGLVANIILTYGIFAAIGSFLSGTLSSLLSPRRTMVIGAIGWAVFEVLFLSFALPAQSVPLIILTYGVRGLFYPLFAFSFLTWINRAVDREQRGGVSGWFWFSYTGGLPVFGTAVAFVAIPLIGEYATFWVSLGLVVCGAVLAILGTKEGHGRQKIVREGVSAGQELWSAVSLAWRIPKVGRAAITRIINTGAQYGFFVALPLFLQNKDGVAGGPAFSQQQYLAIVIITFGVNMIANPFTGRFSDRIGWVRMIAGIGAIGCVATTLLLNFVPLAVGTNFVVAAIVGALYGITLAGFVPLSAYMPSIVPEEEQGNAISVYAFAAGLSTVLGPLVFTVANPVVGITGVMIVFALLYAVSAALAFTLRDGADPATPNLPTQGRRVLRPLSRKTDAHPRVTTLLNRNT